MKRESVRKKQRREANLDLEETSDVDHELEAGEVLLDQIEQDVVCNVELEQEFSQLMEKEDDKQVNLKRNTIVFTDPKCRLETRGRRVIRINQQQQFMRQKTISTLSGT